MGGKPTFSHGRQFDSRSLFERRKSMAGRHSREPSRRATPGALIGAMVVLWSLAACTEAPETYAQACNTPLPGWNVDPGIPEMPTVILIAIDRQGSVHRTGRRTDLRTLAQSVEAGRSVPSTFYILQPAAEAPCDVVRSVRSLLTAKDVCRDSSCFEGPVPRVFADRFRPPS
jgi:hypothetical protein